MIINRNGSVWIIQDDLLSKKRLMEGLVPRFDTRQYVVREMTNESGAELRRQMIASGQLAAGSLYEDTRVFMTEAEIAKYRSALIKAGLLKPAPLDE